MSNAELEARMEKDIKLKCVYCLSSSFEVPYEGYKPQSDEMITCGSCGKENDVERLRENTIEEGRNELKNHARDLAREFLTKSLGKNLEIKIKI